MGGGGRGNDGSSGGWSCDDSSSAVSELEVVSGWSLRDEDMSAFDHCAGFEERNAELAARNASEGE